MKRNQEITLLAAEIMNDLTNNLLPLHSVLLKTSRLATLLDMPDNVDLFIAWAKDAEHNSFVVETFKSDIEAAADRDVSLSSANTYQTVSAPSNMLERRSVRERAATVVSASAAYRTQAYKFALNIYTKWQFGNVAENIFEKKRDSVEPVLNQVFPDAQQRLNSIEQNLRSQNPEDWKNAVASCRALLMDVADVLQPPKNKEDKNKYINRLKDFISPKITSSTQKKLAGTLLEELKNRIEYTMDLTQGAAHKDRPLQKAAEDVVLYTYLAIAELLGMYREKVESAGLNNTPPLQA